MALLDVDEERTGVEPIDDHVGSLREWVRSSVPGLVTTTKRLRFKRKPTTAVCIMVTKPLTT